MINPIPHNNKPKPAEQALPPPPPPKAKEAPKKIDNSHFEGAITQAKGSAKPPIKLNLNSPAPPVIQPKENGTNLNKIL